MMMRRFLVLLLVAHTTSGVPIARAQAEQDGSTFSIVTWNTTQLGHPDYPPADDRAQIESVGQVLRAVAADVYAIQEVASPSAFAEITSFLGSGYAGLLAGGCDLCLGLIYRTQTVRVTWASDLPLAEYSFDFGGRPPLFAQLDLTASPETDDLLLAIVHLKAFADVSSYERRLRALEILKAMLEEEPAANAVVAGDFNDLLFRSITEGRDSPMRAFRLDSLRYVVPGAALEREGMHTYCANPSCDEGSVLDHFIVTTGLSAWEPTVRRMDGALKDFPGFVASTSDHLPLLLTLQMQGVEGVESVGGIQFLDVFPNPFSTTIEVRYEAPEGPVTFELIDALGRVRLRTVSRDVGENNIMRLPGRGLPAGVYLLRAHTPASSVAEPVVHVR